MRIEIKADHSDHFFVIIVMYETAWNAASLLVYVLVTCLSA